MDGLFPNGGNGLPVSQEEIQLVSLIGFILVGLVYSCGSLKQNPERILKRMRVHSKGSPELSKATEFIADALKKHPVDTYGKWFVDKAQFTELARHFRTSTPDER